MFLSIIFLSVEILIENPSGNTLDYRVNTLSGSILLDGKSVVKGKRVNHGGGRNINKQKDN